MKQAERKIKKGDRKTVYVAIVEKGMSHPTKRVRGKRKDEANKGCIVVHGDIANDEKILLRTCLCIPVPWIRDSRVFFFNAISSLGLFLVRQRFLKCLLSTRFCPVRRQFDLPAK